ncbi:hypothetical protein LZ318_03345 [Saccharopolyspora indica]|uniref:hypothetical protein n=1 Tax=Saccharopolyspora indica TaxID=1229659 RepID=UPI0022EB5DBF|nr:hypothetical protein [Saccharopolyspora indica]MDA3649936.1 hypothetical protein [Saccharopolyspora indica]
MTFTQNMVTGLNKLASWLANRKGIPFPQFGHLPGHWYATRMHAQLPGAINGSSFEASFELHWQVLPEVPPDLNPETFIKSEAGRLAQALTKQSLVTQRELVQAEINRHLASLTGPGLVGRGEVTLAVSDEHRKGTESYLKLLQHRENSVMARAIKAEEREYLRTEVFPDRQAALLWWVQDDPGRANKLGDLERLLEHYEGGPNVEVRDGLLGELETRLAQLDEASREHLLRSFAEMIELLTEPESAAV